jgi:hypothetical protein
MNNYSFKGISDYRRQNGKNRGGGEISDFLKKNIDSGILPPAIIHIQYGNVILIGVSEKYWDLWKENESLLEKMSNYIEVRIVEKTYVERLIEVQKNYVLFNDELQKLGFNSYQYSYPFLSPDLRNDDYPWLAKDVRLMDKSGGENVRFDCDYSIAVHKEDLWRLGALKKVLSALYVCFQKPMLSFSRTSYSEIIEAVKENYSKLSSPLDLFFNMVKEEVEKQRKDLSLSRKEYYYALKYFKDLKPQFYLSEDELETLKMNEINKKSLFGRFNYHLQMFFLRQQ